MSWLSVVVNYLLYTYIYIYLYIYIYIYIHHFIYHTKFGTGGGEILSDLFFVWLFETCKFHYLPQMALKLYIGINIYIYISYVFCIYTIYNIIIKTMCAPVHHHNDFLATLVLGHMMYGYTLLVPMNIYYIVTLHAFYMNLTKYKLNYKKSSRQKYACARARVCVCVCVCVYCSFISHKNRGLKSRNFLADFLKFFYFEFWDI